MIAASYPNIAEEEASIELITKGLSSSPVFADIHRSYLTHGFPDSLDQLHSRLILLESENKHNNMKVVNLTNSRKEQQKPRNPKRTRSNRGEYRSNNSWRGGRNNNQIPP